MITHILENASPAHLQAAQAWGADVLHVPQNYVGFTVAVAYEQGTYEGWEGFVAHEESSR